MKTNRITILILSALFLFSLGSNAQENVNLKKLLPEEAIAELFNAYPDLKVTQVGKKKDANTSVEYRNTYLRIDGIKNQETRDRIAQYVVQYLENPNKRIEDRKKRDDYEALHPEKKMAMLKERIIDQNPNFKYEWVHPELANVKAKYGERGLNISGIENEGEREEWAYAIVQLHKEMEEVGREGERRTHEERGDYEMEIAELRLELAEARLHLAEMRNELRRRGRDERERELRRERETEIPPKQMREQFIERMKKHYPKFGYEWVGRRQGNVEAVYGDNSLIIKGVEDAGARHEIAVHLINLQKRIDKEGQGEEVKIR